MMIPRPLLVVHKHRQLKSKQNCRFKDSRFSSIYPTSNNNHFPTQEIISKDRLQFILQTVLNVTTNHSILPKDSIDQQRYIIPLEQQRTHSKFHQLSLPIDRQKFILKKHRDGCNINRWKNITLNNHFSTTEKRNISTITPSMAHLATVAAQDFNSILKFMIE